MNIWAQRFTFFLLNFFGKSRIKRKLFSPSSRGGISLLHLTNKVLSGRLPGAVFLVPRGSYSPENGFISSQLSSLNLILKNHNCGQKHLLVHRFMGTGFSWNQQEQRPLCHHFTWISQDFRVVPSPFSYHLIQSVHFRASTL